MKLRNDIETLLRSWDAHERERGATPIIDYDLHPSSIQVDASNSRLEVLGRLSGLRSRIDVEGDRVLASRTDADIAYLRALLGERQSLSTYIGQTQGCSAAGWPGDYVRKVGDVAREQLAALGIEWDAATAERWKKIEGELTAEQAAEAIRSAATEYEPAMRALVGTAAPFEYTVETVTVDAYWAYWLDGKGSQARLRLNLRQARFTEVVARQFALHEILGHALQGASLAARAANDDVPWVRLLSVHAPQQVLFEGLAQALPLFLAPQDQQLAARVRVAHYLQFVRAELHLAINNGTTVDECANHARVRVPFWDDGEIADALTDRSTNPQLRSYLWSYPAGIDWFVRLVDEQPDLGVQVLRAAYRDPLTPADLQSFWPDGPTVGGEHSGRALPGTANS